MHPMARYERDFFHPLLTSQDQQHGGISGRERERQRETERGGGREGGEVEDAQTSA